MTDSTDIHGTLMDDIYRHQRRIYDVTRKYYLLGRDRLIDRIDAPPGARVLEIACGTGRNLDLIGRRYPDCTLYGLDISSQMLASARAKLGARATLAQGDACAFDPETLFGQAQFDRVVLSYSLSMIPDWQGAVAEALRHVAPGGRLLIVDFGDQVALPRAFRTLLRAWLAKFHVSPREDLQTVLHGLGAASVDHTWLYRRYAQMAVVTPVA
ncbi:MAG: SAM-dependent methyltransferase [Rhodobacteraceae bacterium]|nr:SAM-dependent methyltransferase [Paracoccaceae bacterium]QEW17894.1 Demethylmenaquinone methyltransferase [Marinibacterium anthonyi]